MTQTGKPENRAVVGATWLALMAIPIFRQSGGGGRRPDVVGWDMRRRGGPALRWPIWRQALDRNAIEVLLSHPAVTEWASAEAAPAARLRDTSRQLRALGVEAVCVASRMDLTNSAGPLRMPVVTPVPG